MLPETQSGNQATEEKQAKQVAVAERVPRQQQQPLGKLRELIHQAAVL